jgi:hypothetical protein
MLLTALGAPESGLIQRCGDPCYVFKSCGFESTLARVTRINREEVGLDACQQAGPHDSRSDVPQDGEFGEAGAANETNPTPTNEARVVPYARRLIRPFSC